MPSISPQVTPYYGGGQVGQPVDSFRTSGAPSTANINHNLGTLAIDNATGTIYGLASKSGSSATWVALGGGSADVRTINGLSPSNGNINIAAGNIIGVNSSGSTVTVGVTAGGYPITPFVVGPINNAGYQTIQSAINAATAAGGGIVYIQPGTYVENLTMGVGIHLVGIIGTSGNMVLTDDGGEAPSVTIIGNFTLDVTAAQTVPTTEIHNILITATSGNIFSYVGNINLLESGYLTFFNCYLQTGTGSTALFHIDGFMNINFESCVINEATPNTTTFSNFGTTHFINFNSRNSVIQINQQNACVLPNNSFVTWALQNTFYTARMDLSGGSSSLSFQATNSFFEFDGGTPGDALVEFGSNDGSVIVQNCIIENSSGSLGNSTTVDANSVFRYTSCVFENPLVIGSTGRGDFTYCKFFGGASAAITMSSSQAVSFIDCVFSSSNNPCISGSGAGTITLGDITFLSNSNIAGTLTLSWVPTKTGALTATGAISGTTTITAGTGITATNGNLTLGTAGNKISIATGSNASVGTSSAMVAGTTTVNTTAVTASSKIFLTPATVSSGTQGVLIVGTITPGTSFVINSSSNTDTSAVNWWIVN